MKEFFSRIIQDIEMDWIQYLIDLVAYLLIFLILSTLLYQSYDLYSLIVHQGQKSNFSKNGLFKHEIHQTNSKHNVFHLFGLKDQKPVAELNMKWTLRGIILAKDMKNNLAIISSSDTDEALYKAGDILADGTLIIEIDFDSAQLSINGQKQTLLLWENNDKQDSDASDLPDNKNQGEE